MNPILEYFRGRGGQWYWRVKSINGQVVAVGGEGYTRKADARRGFERVAQTLPYAYLR